MSDFSDIKHYLFFIVDDHFLWQIEDNEGCIFHLVDDHSGIVRYGLSFNGSQSVWLLFLELWNFSFVDDM